MRKIAFHFHAAIAIADYLEIAPVASHSAGLDNMTKGEPVQRQVTETSNIHEMLQRVLDAISLDLDVTDKLFIPSASLLAAEVFLFCSSGPGLTF